jgi:ribonuclease J
MNHIAMRGAEVVHEGLKHVHVSGHGSEEELKLMLSLVRPRHFVPIHGEYRQLALHARVARRVTGGDAAILLAQNGDVIRFEGGQGRIADRVPAGRVLIDGTRTGEVADEVLRDRRHLSGDGLVVPVLAINRQSGALEGVPDVITRGFVVDDRSESVLADVGSLLTAIVETASVEERTDVGLIRERVRVELQRVVRKRSGRRPLVLPVVMEV